MKAEVAEYNKDHVIKGKTFKHPFFCVGDRVRTIKANYLPITFGTVISFDDYQWPVSKDKLSRTVVEIKPDNDSWNAFMYDYNLVLVDENDKDVEGYD